MPKSARRPVRSRPLRSVLPRDYWLKLFTTCLIFFVFSVSVVIAVQHRTVFPQLNRHAAFRVAASPTPSSTPLPSPAPEQRVVRIPILIYHYVEIVKDIRDTIRQSLDIQPAIFEQQILTLQQAGYQFWTMGGVMNALAKGEALPEKVVVLTFDDGYRDFYTDVFPLLKKHNVKATMYMVSDFQNGKNYLTTAQLQELAKSPLVEIGAHTRHHVALSNQSPIVLEREVMGSKKALEEQLGISVPSFAYPYGTHDAAAEQAVQGAGFTSAVLASNPDRTNQWTIGRIRPGRTTGKQLLEIVENTPKSFTVVP